MVDFIIEKPDNPAFRKLFNIHSEEDFNPNLIDVSKVVNLDKTDFVRSKQCLTRKINRLIKQNRQAYFRIGYSDDGQEIIDFSDVLKVVILAASKDKERIERLANYYIEKYTERLRNINSTDTTSDNKQSEDNFYLYIAFLKNPSNTVQ